MAQTDCIWKTRQHNTPFVLNLQFRAQPVIVSISTIISWISSLFKEKMSRHAGIKMRARGNVEVR